MMSEPESVGSGFYMMEAWAPVGTVFRVLGLRKQYAPPQTRPFGDAGRHGKQFLTS